MFFPPLGLRYSSINREVKNMKKYVVKKIFQGFFSYLEGVLVCFSLLYFLFLFFFSEFWLFELSVDNVKLRKG